MESRPHATSTRRIAWILAATALLVLTIGCWIGYSPVRKLATLKSNLDARWVELQTPCQRRAEISQELVPILSANDRLDQKLVTDLVQARAGLEHCQLKTQRAPVDGAPYETFEQSQRALHQALFRALTGAIHNPELKADQKFRAAVAQLLGVGKDLAIRQNRFVQAGLVYNDALRHRPTSIYGPVLGFKPRLYFERADGVRTQPL